MSWCANISGDIRQLPMRSPGRTFALSQDYPTKAKRPGNSRHLTRLQRLFGVTTPHWRPALAAELDVLARELTPQAGVSEATRQRAVQRARFAPSWSDEGGQGAQISRTGGCLQRA